MSNVDEETVASFGDEWSRYSQSSLSEAEHARIFDDYFHIFPWNELRKDAEGFDMGCGSGRWAKLVAPKVGTLHCIDPSIEALAVAKRNLTHIPEAKQVHFHNAMSSTAPLASASQDFGYSLGVLHHIPDTAAALADCVRLLKPGAPFLVYLYYRFDNQPAWYRLIWKASEIGRRTISASPRRVKSVLTEGIAASVYLPLARSARIAEKLGRDVSSWPLSSYRELSFYTMRTDARDRFGTPLEQRFTKDEIREMMERAGLERIRFSDRVPYWCAVGYRK